MNFQESSLKILYSKF